MSSYSTSWTAPAPVASIAPAAVYAAGMVGMKVTVQTPYSVRCKSGISLTTYPVTVEIAVSGVDGAAAVNVYAHNFGFGPLQSGACQDRATRLLSAMSGILQDWARQAAQAAARPAGPAS